MFIEIECTCWLRIGEGRCCGLNYYGKFFGNAEKKEARNNEYINCDFILGSVAGIERLWSMAKTSSQRIEMRITPQLSEQVCF